MIIKQKRKPGRELVEYTEGEISALSNFMGMLMVLSILVSCISCIFGWAFFAYGDESVLKLDGGLCIALIFIIWGVGLGLALVLWPLCTIVSRHSRKSKTATPGSRNGSIKEYLADWFLQASYYKAIVLLGATAVVNSITAVGLLLVLLVRYAPIIFVVSGISLIGSVLWLIAGLCVPAKVSELKVIIIPENINSGAPEDPAT